ncbi:MAG TPA: tail fiber protein, partial [Steroidobacteraceae bacterium]
EIRMFGGNFPPSGWALCDGQLMAISQNTALFSLLGTQYGGDGVQTFALPDLRGRVPIHQGVGPGLPPFDIGQIGGEENLVLTVAQMPKHSHAFVSAAAPTLDTPAQSALGSAPGGVELYAPSSVTGLMHPNANVPVGSNQPHPNVMPYLCTTFIIALQGIFPSRN